MKGPLISEILFKGCADAALKITALLFPPNLRQLTLDVAVRSLLTLVKETTRIHWIGPDGTG
jgi:hypothetical protein